MVTCFIRYTIDPAKLDAFEEYARAWMVLIRKYGGVHHGYFRPARDGEALPEAAFSFPGLGHEGPPNTAVAIFSFFDVAAYERYRAGVATDEARHAATARFHQTKPFTSYERTFLVPVEG
jgi:hypothetical protein